MADFALSELFDAVAQVAPERECIVQAEVRLSYADVQARSRRLASYLAGADLGVRRARSTLAGWESGQDHVALYLYNCPEYLEAMLACFRARAVPGNVNSRYGVSELVPLLRGQKARALVYDRSFAPLVREVLAQLPELHCAIEVGGAGPCAVPGAISYAEALARGDPAGPSAQPEPDDLYILYTGGTTGL